MRASILTLLFACCFSLDVVAVDASHSYALYLIRHAEKQLDGSSDPGLTEAGKHRSEQLAKWFQDKDIEDIWSSDYRRTRDTANPLLIQSGLELSLYDPDVQTVLVKHLLDRQHNALVMGHSNTIPELARLLCQCAITAMDESEHDRMIVISVTDGEAKVRALQQNRLFRPINLY